MHGCCCCNYLKVLLCGEPNSFSFDLYLRGKMYTWCWQEWLSMPSGIHCGSTWKYAIAEAKQQAHFSCVFNQCLFVLLCMWQSTRPARMMRTLPLPVPRPATRLPPPARHDTESVGRAGHIAVEEPGMTATDQVNINNNYWKTSNVKHLWWFSLMTLLRLRFWTSLFF